MQDLILHEEDIITLNIGLTKLIDIGRADCVMLINKSGRMITAQSETGEYDKTSLAALIVGNFSSSSSIARLLGEEEFSSMLQEGVNRNLFVQLVDMHTILGSVFDVRRTTLDKLKSVINQTIEPIRAGLSRVYSNVALDPELNLDVSSYHR